MDEAPKTEAPPQPQPEQVGDRLKKLREEKGFTKVQVGDRVGVSPACVAAWENNQRNPKRLYTTRLALMLGVTYSYLQYGGPRVDTTNAGKGRAQTTAITKEAFKSDEALSNAVEAAAESKFERGLRLLNLTQEQIELALTSHKFKHENMLDTVETLGGMLDRQVIFLFVELTNLNKKINDPQFVKERGDMIVERSRLHYDIAQFVRINQAGLMLSARVQQIWHEINGKKKGEKKVRTLDLSDPK